MKSKRFFALLIAVFMLFSLVACNQNKNNEASGTQEVIDMTGRTVTVPTNIDKVFMDWAQGTLHMMTLGALDKVVAVRTAFGEGDTFAWARTIYPDFSKINLDDAPFSNVEALVAYEPDVIFSLYDGNDDNIKKYESVGIPVVAVRFQDYDTFKQSMALIGKVLGGDYETKAGNFVDFFDGNIELVTDRLKDISESEKRLIHYVDGRDTDALRTVGRDQVEATWIKTAGGRFSTEEYTGRQIDLTEEKFLQLNPDIILVGSQSQAPAMKWLLDNTTLQNLDAVKNDNVHRIPQGLFPWCKMGPEASMQMVWAAKFLYPDNFQDIDIAQMAKGFYRDFLGADVSDEHLVKILEGRLSPTGE